MSRSGFTLIELLVVLAISALFSTFAIISSSIGQNEVAMTVDSAKISQFIQEARALSLSTYTSNSSSCGYGVSFNPGASTYSIFAYSPVANGTPCPSIDTITTTSVSVEQSYTSSTWNVPLSQGVVMNAGSNQLLTIMFYPPAPTAFISEDGSNFLATPPVTNIYLATVDGRNSTTIAVYPDGQVNSH